MKDEDKKYTKVKKHLLRGKSITQTQAVKLYEAWRLSAIIYRLRYEEGLTIKTERIKNSSGHGTYAKYKLEK